MSSDVLERPPSDADASVDQTVQDLATTSPFPAQRPRKSLLVNTIVRLGGRLGPTRELKPEFRATLGEEELTTLARVARRGRSPAERFTSPVTNAPTAEKD